jgi:predicted MFS family arabinose efflux permease
MGALGGVAFSLVYATVALPLARLADRINRRNLLAVAVAFWSTMTALCGFASSFVHLLLARIGVAAGEAAQQPSTMSMIADFFPSEKRGAAISVVTIGSAAGFALGAAVAGLLNDHFGWHIAMMAVGFPGLLLAVVIFLTVPEPKRGRYDKARPVEASTMLQDYKRLLKIRTMPALLFGMIFLNVAFMGFLLWLTAFLMRTHDMSTGQAGSLFGLIVGVGAIIANVFAGVASDRLQRRGARYRMYFCIWMIAIGTPVLVAGLLVHQTSIAVALLMAYTLASGGLTTVTSAAILSIAPSNLRASATAFIGLAVAVFGGGAGPLIVGMLNDLLKQSYGDEAIRFTLLSMPIGLVLAAVGFWWASRTIDRDAALATGDGPVEATRLHH